MANGGIIGTVNNPTSTTATGVWQQEEQYEAVRDGTWPSRPLFTTKSARFNSGSSDYLNRTPSSASNRDLWSISAWVKRSNLGVYSTIYGVFTDSNNQENFGFLNSDKFQWQLYQSGGVVGQLTTNRLFRDPSAWYHILGVYDSANSTGGNRMRLYVNGVEETSFSTDTNPSSGRDSLWNNNTLHMLGAGGGASGGDFLNGYMSEIIAVDGTALSPTDVGVTNSDGVWTPIIYTGTYGTNGFNLQFENAAALGTDSSPNGNTFTVNNLTSIDQSTDYPEVNFSTFNALDFYHNATANTGSTSTEGNLRYVISSGNKGFARSTIAVSNGKWYWEAEANSVSKGFYGVCNNGIMVNGTAAQVSAVYFYEGGPDFRSGDQIINTGVASISAGDILGFALDMDNYALYISKNGTYMNSGNPTSGSSRTGAISELFTNGRAVLRDFEEIYANVLNTSTSGGIDTSINFGSPPYSESGGNSDGNGYGNFKTAVPSGYYSLNTKNLGEFG